MVDYEKILNSGNIISPKKLASERVLKPLEVYAKSTERRCYISIPSSLVETLGFVKGDCFNIVALPNGKFCLCKVRSSLGFAIYKSEGRVHYINIPRLKTKDYSRVLGFVEDGLILFPPGSFEQEEGS